MWANGIIPKAGRAVRPDIDLALTALALNHAVQERWVLHGIGQPPNDVVAGLLILIEMHGRRVAVVDTVPAQLAIRFTGE